VVLLLFCRGPSDIVERFSPWFWRGSAVIFGVGFLILAQVGGFLKNNSPEFLLAEGCDK
jgi:hypothetical protein